MSSTMLRNSVKYISGPISHGDRMENIHRAIMVGEYYFRRGYTCYIPHLDYSWIEQYPKEYEDIMMMDLAMLKRMRPLYDDELVRLPGYSPGADQEVEYACKHNIDVNIMTVIDCEAVEEALGEAFPCMPVGQRDLKVLTKTHWA